MSDLFEVNAREYYRKHAPLARKSQCRTCHKRGRYKTGKTACVDCHEDSHKGQLGSECESCHSADVGFAEAKFDHDQQTKFPIEGLHKKLDCGKCWLNGHHCSSSCRFRHEHLCRD